MPTKQEYQEKYNAITTVQEWIDLLNDPSLNYFELTQSLSQYRPGDSAFWKIAEIDGDWKFNLDALTTLIYNATDVVVSNMFGSERPVIEQNKRQYGYNRYQLDKISKKIVDESAKESCRKSIKEFLKRNTYMPLADSMSDEVLIRTIKGFADNREVSKANELAWQLYQIAKPLF
jgi:hypothetical protein